MGISVAGALRLPPRADILGTNGVSTRRIRRYDLRALGVRSTGFWSNCGIEEEKAAAIIYETDFGIRQNPAPDIHRVYETGCDIRLAHASAVNLPTLRTYSRPADPYSRWQ